MQCTTAVGILFYGRNLHIERHCGRCCFIYRTFLEFIIHIAFYIHAKSDIAAGFGQNIRMYNHQSVRNRIADIGDYAVFLGSYDALVKISLTLLKLNGF